LSQRDSLAEFRDYIPKWPFADTGGVSMLHRILVIAVVCCVFGEANAQNIPTFNAPTYVAPPTAAVQMGNQALWQSTAVQQQIQNQQLQMQLQQERNRQTTQAASAAIGEGVDRLVHACDPDVLRRPGIHLMARLGLCPSQATKALELPPQPQHTVQQPQPSQAKSLLYHTPRRFVRPTPEYASGSSVFFDALSR
jgi:hypothetical protein